MSIRLWDGGDASCLGSFWHRGQRGQIADWDSIIDCIHSWWQLQGGSHWPWHGWIYPLQAEGALALISDGASRATVVDLLRVLLPGTGLGVLRTAFDSSSWSSAAMLVRVAVSLGHSMAECREEGGVEVPQGAKAMGMWPPSITLKRSTCNSEGLQMGLPRVSMSHTGGSRSKNCMGSISPFRPLGYTTWFPHCRSLCISSGLRCLQVLLFGMPCIFALMYPSQDKGMCKASSLSCKRQRSNHCLYQWVGWVSMMPHPRRGGVLGVRCTHTATRPKTLSPSMVLSGAFKRNAMSCLGFSMFPHAPAWERARIGIMIRKDWYHEIPTPPVLTAPTSWHSQKSVYSHPLLIVCNQGKSVS